MVKTHNPQQQLQQSVDSLILHIRGERVMLDADLAHMYGVTTKALNQAVKRNLDRFPPDFLSHLTKKEWSGLRSQVVNSKAVGVNRSQIVTGSQKHRSPRTLPYAFTEHGAIMAANVLNSKRAVYMSVFVVRAFIRMRCMLTDNKELARKLAELEKDLKKRLDIHETAIVGILQRIMDLVDPPALPEPKKRPIGFGREER